MDDDIETKKAKGVKKKMCNKTQTYVFENYKDSLFKNKTLLLSQKKIKSNHHNVYMEKVNKIALHSNDNKILQTFDRVTTYPYRTNAF